MPIRARTLVTLLVGLDVLFYFLTRATASPIWRNVGGVLRLLFFRCRGSPAGARTRRRVRWNGSSCVQSGLPEPERRRR